MPAKFCRSSFCMLLLALAGLHAEEKMLGPRDLVGGLMENNPEIRAARFRFEAATKRPSQAGTLPEPKASYTNVGVGHPLSRLNASEFAYHGFGVSQELPFPGKLGLASEEAKREADAEQQNYRAVVLDVTARPPGEIQLSSLSMSLDELLRAANESPRVKGEQKMIDARAVGINRSLKDFGPTSE